MLTPCAANRAANLEKSMIFQHSDSSVDSSERLLRPRQLQNQLMLATNHRLVTIRH